MEEKSKLRRFTDWLFGGIELTWTRIVLYAVITAVLTAVFLVVPIFRNTSFYRVGGTTEAWILFAVIIISNAKSPLESALKTFVFFLISQPLIYLLQVPFSWMGWGIFQYYLYWFILTLCTFPAAYIGWYIKKKNWLSLLILMPMLLLLVYTGADGLKQLIHQFPRMLIMTLFCIGQVLLYLYAFTENIFQKIAGLTLPVLIVAVMLLLPKNIDFSSSQFLPDDPVLTENAAVTVEDTGIVEISLPEGGETVLVHVHKYGTTSFTIEDGGQEYSYNITVYEDEAGVSQIEITAR